VAGLAAHLGRKRKWGLLVAIERGLVLLITSNRLGEGDDELGEALILKLLNELAATASLPEKIFLLNSGVKLVADDSPALLPLRKLEAAGVEIAACGTCVEWFNLGNRLAVGKQTNMTSVVACATAAAKVICL
jgi:selenium metabolism protein YedF